MSQVDVLLALVSNGEIRRMESLLQAGVTASTVQRAVASGLVERVSRGVYQRAGSPRGVDAHLAEASVRVPKGVVCLTSAAEAHGLVAVSEVVWMALPHNIVTPRVEWPAIRYVRFRNADAFTVGVDVRTISGVPVGITDPARTVVDMLRMANKVGRPTALACLRAYHLRGLPTEDVQSTAGRLGWTKWIEPVLETSSAMLEA